MPATKNNVTQWQGLAKSFDVLRRTRNEAAVPVLTAALDSVNSTVSAAAFRTLALRRSTVGHEQLIARVHMLPDDWQNLLSDARGRITGALRSAVIGENRQLFLNAQQLIVGFREYDLVPSLAATAEDANHPNAPDAAATLVELTELLYYELASPRNYRDRRDPQQVRRHVLGALESALTRYPRHKKAQIVESFLLITQADNATLRVILQDPLHPCYRVVVQLLTESPRVGVMRLMLNWITSDRAPLAGLRVCAHREDTEFLSRLLIRIGDEPSQKTCRNLKRLDRISWLEGTSSALQKLDDNCQVAAVKAAQASSVGRQILFDVLQRVVRTGQPAARAAACDGLAQFNGDKANQLVLRAIEDPDARVQIAAAAQLRQRGIPGAMACLTRLLESPHEDVRSGARAALDDFTFTNFKASFDVLDEQARQSTGALVLRVDTQALASLRDEIEAPVRQRRLRGLAMAVSMRAIPFVADAVIDRLQDDDHFVRAEAARSLRHCDLPHARQALQLALQDRSTTVQEVARESLQFFR